MTELSQLYHQTRKFCNRAMYIFEETQV